MCSGSSAAEHRPGRKSDVGRSAVDCFSVPHPSWRRNYEADHTAVDCFILARCALETRRRDGPICGRPLFAAPSTAAGCHRSATVGEAKVPPMAYDQLQRMMLKRRLQLQWVTKRAACYQLQYGPERSVVREVPWRGSVVTWMCAGS